MAYKLAAEIQEIKARKKKAKKKRKPTQFELAAQYNETIKLEQTF